MKPKAPTLAFLKDLAKDGEKSEKTGEPAKAGGGALKRRQPLVEKKTQVEEGPPPLAELSPAERCVPTRATTPVPLAPAPSIVLICSTQGSCLRSPMLRFAWQATN